MKVFFWTILLLPVQETPEAALARKCDGEIPWITDGVEVPDGTPRFPDAPGVDRSRLLEQAKAIARDKNRLILWYCPRVAGTHMYRAPVLDGYARAVFFTDPGVVDLVKAKFVPLRMTCDEKLGSAIGVRKPDFVEPGFIVLTPEGRVVHTLDRLRTFNADWLRAVLVEILRRNDAYNRPAGEGVEELIRGGDDERALPRATADQKAVICRRAGRYREVLDLQCAPIHKGIALAALEDFEGARKILEKEDSAEALYFRAAIEGWTGKDPERNMALSISRPLLGQRVRDLLAVAAALDEDGRGIHVVGVGAAAPVALHAALLDPRIRRLTLEEMVISWSQVAKTPITVNQLTNVVPGALRVYDLPDLAVALAPRPLAIRFSTDPAGKPVSRAALEDAYRAARSAYAERGADSSLVLEAREP